MWRNFMKYSEHSLKQRSKKECRAYAQSWAFKEGVFLTPHGKYIARIKDHRGYVTLSQHNTEDEAKKVYDAFYTT